MITTNKRDEYTEKIKQQLDEWNSEIDRLEAKGEEIKGEAQKKYDAQIKELRQNLRSVRNKIEELQSSGQETWEEFKAQVEHVQNAFIHSLNYFKSQL
jgi:uncharacterized protein YukE